MDLKIIVSFLTTAWLVVGLLIVYYTIYHDPHVQPSHSPDGRAGGEFRANPFDVSLYQAKNAVFRIVGSLFAKCADAIGHREVLNKFSKDYRPGPAAEAALVQVGQDFLISAILQKQHQVTKIIAPDDFGSE
ncbi:hypothetical protein PG989_012014 [Apiospora arundinis]